MKTKFTSLWLLLVLICGSQLRAQTKPDAVTSFTLVNADTDADIRVLAVNDSINLALLPTHNLNIRANTTPATVGSVVFALSGADTHNQTESLAPYALFSDNGGDYNAWVPVLGRYTLVATPFTEAGGAGTAGTPLILNFKVINRTGSVTAQTPRASSSGLHAYPNPSRDGRYQVVLPEAPQGPVHYTLLSALGAQVAVGTLSADQATTVLTLDFSGQLPAEGLYYVHLESKKLNTQLKLVRY